MFYFMEFMFLEIFLNNKLFHGMNYLFLLIFVQIKKKYNFMSYVIFLLNPECGIKLSFNVFYDV